MAVKWGVTDRELDIGDPDVNQAKKVERAEKKGPKTASQQSRYGIDVSHEVKERDRERDRCYNRKTQVPISDKPLYLGGGQVPDVNAMVERLRIRQY
jgi:hypothetical protein